MGSLGNVMEFMTLEVSTTRNVEISCAEELWDRGPLLGFAHDVVGGAGAGSC